VIFATPEYNYSISGVLKNAIDWASRPPSQPFDGKPVAIMGVTGGLIGTARAQYHLRQILVYLNAHPINKPEVMIGQSAQRFDEAGRLTDEKTRAHVAAMLVSLRDWTRRLQAPPP
jgi:chromate reductase